MSPDDTKDLTIQLNAETNSLIVRGPAARQEQLAKALADLVEKLPKMEKAEAVVYQLERADPAGASRLLLSLLPGVPVAIDTVNRTVAATATPRDQARIKQLLDQLDHAFGDGLITETYVMKRGNPTAVMTAIQPIVPRATLSSDIYNKMLIVTATAEDHQLVKAIVERADGEGDGTLSTKAYPLQYANTSTITVALTTAVPTATVSADTLNKMLIVTANDEDHQRIQAILDQADKRGGGDLITKPYLLQLANPSTISVALRAVVPNATISPDLGNQMLVVTASQEDHQRVQQIVDEADRRSEGEVVTTVYALKFANPTALAYSIKPIAPNATASPDVYNKTIIVTATAKDHERIKAIIDQADKRGGGELLTKAYSVKWANPATVSTALTVVVPDAKISSDTVNKMLIVTANQEDHTKIQDVLKEADTRGGGELVTHAYVLQTANPTTVMLALRPVVPDATIGSDITNKMLVVTASEADHEKIAAVVEEADRRGEGDLVTQAYPLAWANPTALAAALSPVAPNATISPDAYNKSLFVTASAKDHERIKLVIQQADQRGGGELLTKAYPLKWANPVTIRTALAAVVPNATVSSDTVNKMLVVTASQEDHDRIQGVLQQADERGGGNLTTEVYLLTRANPLYLTRALTPLVPDATIGADATAKTLIVTASAEDQALIKKVVEQADRRGEGDLLTKVYPFKLANPRTVAAALEVLIPNAQMSSDTSTNTLIVTGTEEDHKQVEPLVQQLDVPSPTTRVLKPYSVKNADPSEVYSSLSQLFRYDRDINVGYQEETGMILVFAPNTDQEEVAAAIEQIEEATAQRPKATLEVYQLEGMDVDAALDTLDSLLADETPKIQFQVDSGNNQILAIAEPAQQEMIRAGAGTPEASAARRGSL